MGREWPDDMLAAAHEMQDDAAIRVVLVTGEGRAFSAGLDLTRELAAWAACSLEVPQPSLTWAKRLTSRAFDLSFEEFLAEFDRAMDVELGSEEHRAARRALKERKGGG